ncbi:MAG: TatD family hydrolase [Verrucomicrobiota bacterium]
MATLYETHAHLDFPDFDEDRDEVLRRASEAGVARIITIGTNLATSRRALELADRYPQVWATVGVHPNEAAEAPEGFIDDLRALAKHPKVAAIGEIGTDYHRLPTEAKPDLARLATEAYLASSPGTLAERIANDAFKARQAEVFGLQLELAAELGLNVVIHQRDSWADTLSILEPFSDQLRGVFHCFVGPPEAADQVLAMGHLVSFTGIVTFKNATDVQASAAHVPIGKFMVETDCPYLAPHPHRGKRAEPAHTRLVAEKIAELKERGLEDIAEATNATAEEFFRFG